MANRSIYIASTPEVRWLQPVRATGNAYTCAQSEAMIQASSTSSLKSIREDVLHVASVLLALLCSTTLFLISKAH